MTSPFRDSTNVDAFYADSHAGTAELKLAYACNEGLDVALLIGDTGLGKTTILRRLAARLTSAGHAVVDVFYSQLDVDSLLAFLDDELTGDGSDHPAPNLDREARIRRIAGSTRRLAASNRHLAILFDDAHFLRDAAVFETLQLLLNLREKTGVSMTLVLAGQKSLVADLMRFPALAQRVAVTSVLAPLTATETVSYVRHRLAHAGATSDGFTNEVLSAIHQRAAGIPRAIHRMCEMSLLIAQSEGRSQVTLEDLAAADAEMPMFRDAA